MKETPTLCYVDLPAEERPSRGVSRAEQEVLDAVNRKVAAAGSIEEVIDFLFESTRPLWPCDRIGLAFVVEDGRRIVSRYNVADYAPLLLKEGYAEDLPGGSLETVIRLGRTRIINDVEAYLAEHPQSASTRLIVREGLRSNLTCPLSVEGRIVGVLFRSCRRPFAYNEHDVRLHMAVVERLSQAVEKAWRIEQLAAANHAYNETLAFVAHELRGPLAAMMAEARLLAGGYSGELTEEQLRRVNRIDARGRYLVRLVGDYLDLARLESGSLKPALTLVGDLVRDVVEPALEVVASELEGRRMRVERDLPGGPVSAHCDPNLLKIVFVNLLSNAVKYGREGGEVRLSVAKEADGLAAAVRNEGPGFPVDQRSRLFKKFSRVRTPELLSEKGTGIGLYTCWRIVRMHGGRITADSEEGRWAEFGFRIPQPVPEGAGAGP
jgi:hypothetical protein